VIIQPKEAILMKTLLIDKKQKEMRELLTKMHDFGNDAEDCISLLQTAFIYVKSLPLTECRSKTAVIKNEEVMLTEKLTAIAKDHPEENKYVSIPGHLARIATNLEKLSEIIEKKNVDKILYSDRAVNELMFLLQRLAEIIRPASDMILARNKFLCRYVEESEAGIVKMADEYATFHEERLIRGECLPIASSQFIGMLDAIKNTAWHVKGITLSVLK
jgi:Na+/phosphate symporter